MARALAMPEASSEAPKFTLRLNGEFHVLTVTWNVSSQRYYFNLYDSFGTWIITAPLIATPAGRRIESIVYEAKLRSMRVTLLEPHWRPLGQIVDWTFEGTDPDWLQGRHRCEITGVSEFLFFIARSAPALAIDPGQITLCGTAHRYVNLTEGYIENSQLIFRNNAFEVIDGR